MRWLQTNSSTNPLRLPALHLVRPGSGFTILDLGLLIDYLHALSVGTSPSALCYEYAGDSMAEGQPSESNCYLCIDCALRYLNSDIRTRCTPWYFSDAHWDRARLWISDIAGLAGVVLQSPPESAIRSQLVTVAAIIVVATIFHQICMTRKKSATEYT